MNLKYLIQWAWGLQAKQVVGGPPWMDDARFDINGEIDGDGVPNQHQWKIAVQKLLIERFQLQIHHEKREMPAFALVIAKGGPKLTPGDGNVKAHQSMALRWRARADDVRAWRERFHRRFHWRDAAHCDEPAHC